MKKKILIISYFFPPQNAIASHRALSWARYWSAAGHDVHVLTPRKSEGTFDLNGEENHFFIHEIEQGRAFTFLKNGYRKYFKKRKAQSTSKNLSPSISRGKKSNPISGLIGFLKNRGVGSSSRMPDPSDLWLIPATRWIKSSVHDFDLVVSTYGPYCCHFLASKALSLGKAKDWCADFRDLWTDNHVFKGIFPFNHLERFFERDLLFKAKYITTVSEPLKNILSQKYGGKVFCIENGFEPEDLKGLSQSFSFEDETKIRIVYTGTIYPEKRDPSPLFKALKELSTEAPEGTLDKIEIIFYGPNSNSILELAHKFDVERWVKTNELIPREKSLAIQRDTNILLFLEYEAPGIDGVLTGKLFEYLFSKTPIWAIGISSKTLTGKIIEESNSGKAMGKDIPTIKKELQMLIEGRKKSINEASSLIQQYTRKNLADKMLQIITQG